MLVVLGLVVGLLFLAPALLLWTGRLIMANTGAKSRSNPFRLGGADATPQSAPGSIHREADADETPWFRRPMLPAFGNPKSQEQA